LRFLHTSDWHLGRSLEGRSRSSEQEEFVDEICRIASDQQVDAVLLAGDVFDSSNPSAAAEQLFYSALHRLSDGGRRGVVVIAGNHDNPERLVAATPLAGSQGIFLLGLPGQEAVGSEAATGGVRLLTGGQSWLELAVPGCAHSAVILALPYPSESRLKDMLQSSLDDEYTLREEYSQRVGYIFRNLSGNCRDDAVNIAMSHIFVLGGAASDSERPIFSVGGACTVDPLMLPDMVQYTGLGHLHRPQAVAGSPSACRYSGSPLAYSFSESGQSKSVLIVDVLPGGVPAVTEIPLCSGRPLVRWRADGGLPEVYRWLDEGRDTRGWIDLEISLDNPLTMQDIHALRKACPRFVDIRPVYKFDGLGEVRESRAGLPIDQLFVSYYKQRFASAPDEKLVELFMELLGEGVLDDEETAAGGMQL